MRAPLLRGLVVSASLGLLCGCAGGYSTVRLPLSPQSVVARQVAPPCTPTVWVGSDGSSLVNGYTAPNTAPCITLNGSYNGLAFNAVLGLATDHLGRLYVTDLNNFRIVVFTKTGAFVKALSTALNGQNYQPFGVCVSKTGIVGVANRIYNNVGPNGNVEFFPANAANNSTPTGWATGVLNGAFFCAFDKNGNFFATGVPSAGNSALAYVAKANVNLPNKALVNSAQVAAEDGVYSRINSPANDIVSNGFATANSTTQIIKNWKVTGPPPGPLAFTVKPSYTLTSYPSTGDEMYQLAPSIGGANGLIYIGDYGDSAALYAPANGGATTTYNALSGAVGVATYPTGQF